ncbi:MAG TPA: hypothetical protein VG755_20835 [Nannocystaceae bacterium]|nr:hypothetical protein [Nannocystaceae bacterium]
MIRTLFSLALLSCVACSTATDDDRLVVRAAALDGDITSYDVELDGARRLVAIVELDDGEQIIAIGDAAGDLIALAKTHDDVTVEYDIDTLATCDGSCSTSDEIDAELIELAVDGTLAAAPTFRVPASSVQKKLDDTTSGVQSKLG